VSDEEHDIVDRLLIGFPLLTDHEPRGLPIEMSLAWRAEAKEAADEIERLRSENEQLRTQVMLHDWHVIDYPDGRVEIARPIDDDREAAARKMQP